MNYRIHSFRHAEAIMKFNYVNQYKEILTIISNIEENEIIEKFNEIQSKKKNGTYIKSISTPLNQILKKGFREAHWVSEAKIFNDSDFENDTWKLDFAKEDVSLEVAFNHGTVSAWNLLKPTLAGELNHVEKEINTKIGVIITATKDLKNVGGFDNAIGTFELYEKYIKALNNILTIPILLIGLEKIETFKVQYEKSIENKNKGYIIKD